MRVATAASSTVVLTVHFDVLLQDQSVGKLLVTNGTLVHDPQRWLDSMNGHVSLQIAFGREGA